MPKSPVFAKILPILVWGVAALAAPGEPPERAEPWQPPADPDLRRSLAAMERALSQQDLVILSRLLPYQEKVLLRWDEPVRRDGLFTGTQVVLLLSDLFQRYRTERFTLQSGALLPPGSLYHCMGRWVLRAGGGQSQTIELHFSLKQDAGLWTIRELRQTR